jgi:1-acyl-sn-glycerol-3-phosphate acyltransferase
MIMVCTVIVAYLIIVGIPVMSYCRLIRNPRLALRLTRVLDCIVMFLAGMTFEVEGLEKLAGRTGGCVYVGNHRSFPDPFVPFRVLPGDMRFLAKKQVFQIPLVRFALRTMGMIEVDRTNPEAAATSIDRAVAEIMSGKCIVLFPEGTRSRVEGVLPFKKGAFVLAIKAQADIVPFTQIGMDRILKPGSMCLYPGKIKMIVHDPIPTKGLTLDDRDTLLQKTRAVIEQCFLELRN